MAKLLDSSINSIGVNEQTHFDSTTGKLHFRNAMDLSFLMDHNKELRNSGNNGFTKERDLRHIAELDMVTVEKLLLEHGIDVFNADHMPALKRWLRQRENSGFVVCDGKF